jgi:hypothetical protein
MPPIGGLIELRGDGAGLGSARRIGGEFAAGPPDGDIGSRESYHLRFESNSEVAWVRR